MAFKTGNQPLPGYPMPLGEKYLVIFDHTGPLSYTQFVSPSTGGDVIKANGSGLNLGGFDDISSGMKDTTGQIIAYAFLVNGGWDNAVPSVNVQYYSLVTATLGGQSQTAGSEIAAATDLATFSWRFQAVMV